MKENFKKISALAIVGMAAGFASGCGTTSESTKPSTSTPAPVSVSPSEQEISIPVGEKGEEKPFDYVVESTGVSFGERAKFTDFEGRARKDTTKKYTYRASTSMLPKTWNAHTYQENSSTTVTGYTEDGLYEFDYNSDLDGYTIVPSMAKSDPVDVSADFVGDKWGIAAGETGRAYKIELKSNLKFDNGDEIHADDFVESIKLLLNPEAANYRADSVYNGQFKIAGAKNYNYSGRFGTEPFVSEAYGDDEYVYPKDWTKDADGNIIVKNKYNIVLDLTSGGNWGSNGLADYDGAGYFGDERWYSADGSRVRYCDAEGGNVTWRTTAVVGEGDDADYKWYDAETGGNEVTVILDDAIGYILGTDVDTGTPIAWANCMNPEHPYVILANAADEKGQLKLNDTTVKAVQDCIAILHGYDDVDAYFADAGDYAYVEFEEMAFLGSTFDVFAWEDVGVFADDSDPTGNTLIFILEKALTGFYLYYNLSGSMYLVHTDTYKECMSTAQGVYTNTYGTSVDTYVGFGPYKLTSFVDGSEVKFTKNSDWHGYADSANDEFYWTTDIDIKQVVSEDTRLQMFLAGELDSYGLQAADMEDYQSSKYTYYTDGDSTWFVALNPSESNYEAAVTTATPVKEGYTVYKSILLNKDFRTALSFSINRAEYELTLDPTGGVAKALYGNMIISDPESGTAYRTTDEAKEVICKFWGLMDEDGNLDPIYDDMDEAISSITGYDSVGAKALFTKAYEQWVKDGEISKADIDSGKWEVQIMIGQPGSGSSTYYNNGYTYLSAAWTNAVAGTPLEGHLTFKQSEPLGNNYSDALKQGRVDLLFGVGWTGSALDPFSLMEAYVDANYQYDPGWDTTEEMLDVKLTDKSGNTYTLRATVHEWGVYSLQGETIKAFVVDENGNTTADFVKLSAGTDCDPSIRLAILAAVEGAVLNQYDMIPVGLDASASLKGMKVNFGTEEYVYGVGRGGIKYMTYAYDDAAWADFVASQGGTLNYKVSE